VLDTTLGGYNNILEPNVTYISSKGITKMVFTRLRISNDSFDQNFNTSTFTVYYAFSNAYNLSSHGLNSGKTVRFNLKTKHDSQDIVVFTDLLTPGYPDWLAYTAMGIASFFIVLCIFISFLIFIFFRYHPVRKATPWALLLILIGLILLMISVIFTTLSNYNNLGFCIARGYSFSYGFVFIIGSLFAKNQKYYRYYRQSTAEADPTDLKSNGYIARYLIIFVISETILLILWIIVHPPAIFDFPSGDTTKFILCDDNPIVMGVLIGFKTLIVIWALVLSIYSRTITSMFYEVHFVSLSVRI
jgi:hypothetical protein